MSVKLTIDLLLVQRVRIRAVPPLPHTSSWRDTYFIKQQAKPTSALKMEAIRFFETSPNFYHSTYSKGTALKNFFF
jgi:hypothetical protein